MQSIIIFLQYEFASIRLLFSYVTKLSIFINNLKKSIGGLELYFLSFNTYFIHVKELRIPKSHSLRFLIYLSNIMLNFYLLTYLSSILTIFTAY